MKHLAERIKHAMRADESFWNKITERTEKAGCNNINEFIVKAVDFYCSYIDGIEHQDFLAAAIKSEMNGIIGKHANRLSQLEFRLAVELDKVSHIIASACDIDHDQLEKLHQRCIREINDTGRFPDVRKSVERFRMHGEAWEDDD